MPTETNTMRAWTTRGDGVGALEMHRVPIPRPGPAEVLVKITARSLNYRDLLVINGVGDWKPTGDVVPVSDAVGFVVSAGHAVTRFRAGDRVLPIYLPRWREGTLHTELKFGPIGGPVNRGMLAEYVIVDEQEAVPAPTRLDDAHSATLPVAGVTAWHALERTSVGHGAWVLIHGTGGVALIAMQIALARGLRTIMTSSSDEKLSQIDAMGTTATVNYRTTDVAERVREITGGTGADLVLETVGAANLNVSLDAVRVSGQIAYIGVIDGQLDAQIRVGQLMSKNVSLQGIETGSRTLLEDLVVFVDHHRITPRIGASFAVENVSQALAHLQRGDHLGKIVLVE
ncbi:NAD(P)-dependent alcohol dehydrogenase [Rhodococcus sp. IEGM 1381]|uniref:zinc-dependent alcohol dehydrogenase family protein n=1 Tax=Rhodococcus sp. IEGM 1381 TaxID=3047085 RepID=UPI0024B7253C|nr:NAD(P)-dependent alcohol dehydrogenase [Rhodococcus sp. IEGM 1381]MDI9896333.1 NAD(P)-dependent alcohol dehydrogenase [Rhodococcus sp. IEGM 1381]